MQLYNVTLPHKSLIHEVWDLCDADINSYPLEKVVRRVNSSLETLVSKILIADGTWQFDDTNYTDLPVGTGDLVSGQSSYSFAAEYLEILEVMVLDVNGLYRRVLPFDPSELGVSFDEWVTSASGVVPDGVPLYYDKVGDTIQFDKAPTAAFATLTAGLKVRFKRTIKLYTMSDSTTITSGEETREPGIASPYHITVAKMAALPYCKTYKKDRVAQLDADITEETASMIGFYSRREKDVRHQATSELISFR